MTRPVLLLEEAARELIKRHQAEALARPCLFAFEAARSRYGIKLDDRYSAVLTISRGWECVLGGYGGPIWHASIASRYHRAPSRAEMLPVGLAVLAGVGDEAVEFEALTLRSFHLRRRLTAAEALQIGPVEDLRHVEAEFDRRLAAAVADIKDAAVRAQVVALARHELAGGER